ncbi:hypothetical protein ABID26_001275 [Mesorhizobium shonense]|uniref:Uncharacterized protein n=1 Tax=Mesorhizobium shonense TaxID=1209948 RepID=A0ABV2HMU3_9HYPH
MTGRRRPSSACRHLLPVKDGEKGFGRNVGDPPLPVLHGERVRVRGGADIREAGLQ